MKQKYIFRTRTGFFPGRRHAQFGAIVEMTKVDLLGINAFGDGIVRMTSGWFSMTEEIDPADAERWLWGMESSRRELTAQESLDLKVWVQLHKHKDELETTTES